LACRRPHLLDKVARHAQDCGHGQSFQVSKHAGWGLVLLFKYLQT